MVAVEVEAEEGEDIGAGGRRNISIVLDRVVALSWLHSLCYSQASQ